MVKTNKVDELNRKADDIRKKMNSNSKKNRRVRIKTGKFDVALFVENRALATELQAVLAKIHRIDGVKTVLVG